MQRRFLAVAFHVLLRVFASAVDFKYEVLPEELAKERGAQCLDHTPASYYHREQDPEKWEIFIEGGGLCITQWDCILLRKDSFLGSSKYNDPHMLPSRPSSASNTTLNPFRHYSHVYLPYCSGDMWLGSSAEGHVHLFGLQMSGHLILDTIIERLLNTTKLGSAKEIVLAGTSAGGISVYHHIDWFADKMTKYAMSKGRTPPSVTGLSIAGLFFPKRWPLLYTSYVFNNNAPADDFVNWYLRNMAWPFLHPGCLEASKAEGFHSYECFDVSNMLKYIRTPIFNAMNKFDSLQIQGLGLSLCHGFEPLWSDCGGFVRYFGTAVEDTVKEASETLPQHGWFITSEFEHDLNFYWYFEDKEKAIEGVSLRAAYESWRYGIKVVLQEPTCNGDGPCKSKYGHPAVVHWLPNLSMPKSNQSSIWLPNMRNLSMAPRKFIMEKSGMHGDLGLLWLILGFCLVGSCLTLLGYLFSTKRGRDTRMAIVQEGMSSPPHPFIASDPIASQSVFSSPLTAASRSHYFPLEQTFTQPARNDLENNSDDNLPRY